MLHENPQRKLLVAIKWLHLISTEMNSFDCVISSICLGSCLPDLTRRSTVIMGRTPHRGKPAQCLCANLIQKPQTRRYIPKQNPR